MTTDRLPQPGDSFDVFVVSGRRAGKLTGYLCKATALWNGTSQLLPYSRTVTGFTVRTDSLRFGVKFAGRQVHYYTSARAS
jgi:hypothetical protein